VISTKEDEEGTTHRHYGFSHWCICGVSERGPTTAAPLSERGNRRNEERAGSERASVARDESGGDMVYDGDVVNRGGRKSKQWEH